MTQYNMFNGIIKSTSVGLVQLMRFIIIIFILFSSGTE